MLRLYRAYNESNDMLPCNVAGSMVSSYNAKEIVRNCVRNNITVQPPGETKISIQSYLFCILQYTGFQEDLEERNQMRMSAWNGMSLVEKQNRLDSMIGVEFEIQGTGQADFAVQETDFWEYIMLPAAEVFSRYLTERRHEFTSSGP